MNIKLKSYDPTKHSQHIVASLIYSADYEFNALLYGNEEKGIEVITKLLTMGNNYFTSPYLQCAIYNNEIVGVVVGFPGKEKKELDQGSGRDFCKAFGLGPFLKKIGTFFMMNKIISPQVEDGYYINTLCVAPLYRSRGIGAQIIETIAKENGTLYVDVNIYNSKGRKFYEQCGFRIQSENTVMIKGRKIGTYGMKRG